MICRPDEVVCASDFMCNYSSPEFVAVASVLFFATYFFAGLSVLREIRLVAVHDNVPFRKQLCI